MVKPRYLTKSRYKLGLECPTKLFYTKKKEYKDNKSSDSFLAALAEGGFQVGELAKCYYPGGHDIIPLNYEEAEKQTLELLKQDEVIIYEPAIRFENLFIRIDILVKKGNHFDLIEVKAKSYDINNEKKQFTTKKGTLSSEWSPYLYDVAFQKHVLQSAYPNSTINSYLMLADKNAACPTDGLHQKFIIEHEDTRKSARMTSPLEPEELENKILMTIPVDKYVKMIESGKDTKKEKIRSFVAEINHLSKHYKNNIKLIEPIGGKCKKCEFQCNKSEEEQGMKSGFKECWKSELNWQDEDFEESNVLEINNFKKKDKLIEARRIKFDDIKEEDISPEPGKVPGLSQKERQWLQVEKVQNEDITPYLDKEAMKKEMASWTYPLHFIDFETTSMAIPFHKGQRPYDGLAFQFSHHVVHKDGTIEHIGEFLHTERGTFPNYEFIRALMQELNKDEGTIFRYHNHENTYLNMIYNQLRTDDSDINDKEKLCEFIKYITKSVGSSITKWKGPRCMVDLHQLVMRYYYDPHTHGSNSIKDVLPAILNSSKYLQEKYSQPIYGAKNGIKSLNFPNWQWIVINDDKITDPYKLLPKIFDDLSESDIAFLSQSDELKDGGAALTAYARMQFTEMSDEEREAICKALLKYCELDTFAMVMIYEAWREMLKD